MAGAAPAEVLPLDPTLAVSDGGVATDSAEPSQEHAAEPPGGDSPAPTRSRGEAAFAALAPPLTIAQPADTPAPPSIPASDTDPLSDLLSPESSSREAVPNSQAIGRIKLRKPSNASGATTEAPDDRRLREPAPLDDAAASGAPDSPRNLHEAFDSLTADLDRIADRFHPTWEAPSSRRVTRPGEDPEVVVHYPSEWQPPPSERRRLRANWEQATPPLPLSRAPQTSELIDGGWDTPDAEEPATNAQPAPMLLETPAVAATEPKSVKRQARDAELAPRSKPPARRADAPALDSTAPSAVSQTPPAAVARSRAGLWGAGLAAAAVAALVWRSSNHPTAPAGATNAERASSVLQPEQKPEREPWAVDAPVLAPTPASPSPPVAQVTPPSTSTDVAGDPAANDTLPPAPPPTPLHTPVSGAPATSPSPAAGSLRTPTLPTPTPPAPAPPEAHDERLAPSETAEAAGPDPGAVAQALGESAARARACNDPSGPTGTGSIRVLLNPSGGVLNATALGPFQSTRAGRCVENAFRTARTPAYEGRSLSTVYQFSITSE